MSTYPGKLLSIVSQLTVRPENLSMEQWQFHMMDTVAEHLDADKVTFISQLDDRPPVQLTRNTCLLSNKAYLDYYYSLDPLGCLAEESGGLKLVSGPGCHTSVVSLTEVIDRTFLEESEYYNDFLKPQNIHDETVVYLQSGGRIQGVLSLMRNAPGKISGDELELLRYLAPYLSLALDEASSRARIRDLTRMNGLLEEQARNGIIIMDSELAVIYANEKAKEVVPGVITGSSPAFPEAIEEQLRLMKYNRRAGKQRKKKRLSAISCRVKIDNLDLAAEIRPFQNNLHRQDEEAYAVILEPIRPPLFNQEKLRSCFGLSARESEVVNGIFRGLKNSQIAEELYVSETTIKKHIQNICGKMELKSRTAIVYNMLNVLGIV